MDETAQPRRRRGPVAARALVIARILTGSVAVLGVWTVLIGQASARTEPYEGVGTAPRVKGNSARKEALHRARDAALRAAIDALGVPEKDPARAEVLKRLDGWTGAYRILAEEDVGDDVRVTVEVEVDLARLRKHLSPAAPRRPRAFRLEQVEVADTCAGIDQRAVATRLGRLGVLASDAAAPKLRLSLACEDAGAVPFTFVHAVKFTATAQVDPSAGGHQVSIAEFGFGDDASAAESAAVDAGMAHLGERLAVFARGGVIVRVESTGPSSRVRQFETRIEQALVGVAAATVDGIEPGGIVRLHLDTDANADQVAMKLQQLEFTGFQLGGIRVDSGNALSVRLD